MGRIILDNGRDDGVLIEKIGGILRVDAWYDGESILDDGVTFEWKEILEGLQNEEVQTRSVL